MSYLTHGHSYTPEYAIWLAIKQRCLNPNHRNYHRYGGRGIRLCDRWMDFEVFIADVGWRPSPELTLERRDNDGNYEPGNVMWATRSEQANNTSSNVWLTFQEETLTISQWAAKLGIKANTITTRRRAGLPIEKVLSPTSLSNNQWSKCQ